MVVRDIGGPPAATSFQTSILIRMRSRHQELNFVPSYPALPYDMYVAPTRSICLMLKRLQPGSKCAPEAISEHLVFLGKHALDGCACANNACTIVMRMITVTICIVVH